MTILFRPTKNYTVNTTTAASPDRTVASCGYWENSVSMDSTSTATNGTAGFPMIFTSSVPMGIQVDWGQAKWAEGGNTQAGYGSYVPLDQNNRPLEARPPQPEGGWYAKPDRYQNNPCDEIPLEVAENIPVAEPAQDIVELQDIIRKRYDIVKKKIVNEVCIMEEEYEEESSPVSSD